MKEDVFQEKNLSGKFSGPLPPPSTAKICLAGPKPFTDVPKVNNIFILICQKYIINHFLPLLLLQSNLFKRPPP